MVNFVGSSTLCFDMEDLVVRLALLDTNEHITLPNLDKDFGVPINPKPLVLPIS